MTQRSHPEEEQMEKRQVRRISGDEEQECDKKPDGNHCQLMSDRETAMANLTTNQREKMGTTHNELIYLEHLCVDFGLAGPRF